MTSRLARHKVTQNAIWLTLLQAGNYIAQIILIPLLTRRLSIEEFGATMAALAAAQLAFVVTDYGFSLSGTYDVSKSRGDKGAIQKIINQIHNAKVVLILLATMLIAGVSYIPQFRLYQSIFIFAIISIIGRAFQPVWYFQGTESMKFYAVYMSLVRLIYVVAAVSLVRGPGDGYVVLLSLGVADVLGAAIALCGLKRLGYNVFTLSTKDALAGLTASFDYFVSRLAVAIYTSASSIIVGMIGLAEAALYASAEQVYKAGQNVSSPINQALYPFMAKAADPGILFKVIPFVTALLIIGAFGIGYLASPIVALIFGPGYEEAVPVLKVFLITVVVNYIGVSFGYPMFASLGATKIANKTVMLGSFLHLGFIVVLIANDTISALNVAICVLVTESFVMVLRMVLAIRLIKSQAYSSRKTRSSE